MRKHKEYELVPEEDKVQAPLAKISRTLNHLVDPDKALDELSENTKSKPENTATKFFKSRSDAVEQTLEVERPNPSIAD